MGKSTLVRVFVKGGVVSPGYMLKITSVAKKLGNRHIYFGSKQDILFKMNKDNLQLVIQELNKYDVKLVLNEDYQGVTQNITSSFPVYEILPSTQWFTAGTYIEILEGFDYTPRLRINITDPVQNLVPLFFGELNYVASQKENYWHLYLNFLSLHTKLKWPGLILSKDIPGLSKEIEEIYFNNPEIPVNELVNKVQLKNKFYFFDSDENIKLPDGFFPYFEGINPMLHGDRYWAGFYWKNNHYDIPFIEVISELCLKSGLSGIFITPWKSFLVKNIKKDALFKWQQIIGQFGINMRHSSFELNWHLPILSVSSYKLKSYITNRFNKIDIRTYGLTISISGSINRQYTSIVIVSKPLIKLSQNFNFFRSYKIYYAKNFNVNTGKYILYSTVYFRIDIIDKLVELCKEFYIKLDRSEVTQEQIPRSLLIKSPVVFQCSNCLTVYDEKIGDLRNNIPPDTLFRQLPVTYTCPTCDSPLSDFVKTGIDKIVLQG